MQISASEPVCICVPTYNAASSIEETLISILSQNYQDIAVRVVDNASTDSTLDIVRRLKDARITIHSNDRNIGANGNFTRCIGLMSGKYSAIYHSDDVYGPDMVAQQVAFLEKHPLVGAVFSQATLIGSDGQVLGVTGSVPKLESETVELDLRGLMQLMMLHQSFIVCPSGMVRTWIYQEKIRSWGSEISRTASDVEMWIRLAKIRNVAILQERLMKYRISDTQGSHANRVRTERLDFFAVMDHYLKDPTVVQLLTARDFQHYRWCERHERVARAMNLFGMGRWADAIRLIDRDFCWDAIRAASSTRRGAVTLGGLVLLHSLAPFGALRASQAIVKRAKRISWR